ncbi:MAG: fructokinase [Chloroflexi bacterium HGW-Chloroflexi-4]|jgi:fructokinase|nr:MAG: fructokinase [Chloroflexi bacterium HGW-Chloroflexi-4]
MFFGGIEAGGTKFIVGIGDSSGLITDHVEIPTTSPGETISIVVDYFLAKRKSIKIDRIGLASFGPVDLNPKSTTYGYITNTPKLDWMNFDILHELEKALLIPVVIDTDVNAAALAEYEWGAAQGKDPIVYLTVGTGIGGGVIVNGKPLHGLSHPEIGHLRIRQSKIDYKFSGICPFHKNCMEGLASGPAIFARWGVLGQDLSPDHIGWELEAEYLAEGISNLILTISPEIIILGGGVMKNDFLFPMIRRKVKENLNNYVTKKEILDCNDVYIIPPGLKSFSGLAGAIALASDN